MSNDTPTEHPDEKAQRPGIGKYVAGFFGGACLCVGDLLTNGTAATVLKFQAVVAKYIMPDIYNGGSIGILVVGGLGALFCWIWPVPTRGEAFARGFSVFAVLAVGTPYGVIQDSVDEPRLIGPRAEVPATIERPRVLGSSFDAYAVEFLEGADALKTATGQPNARMLADHVTISACRPRYWGIWGLGSLINNSLEWCPTDHTVPSDSTIEIINCWDTGFRHYRYIQFVYSWNGVETVGWISSGKRPDYWRFVQPLKEAENRLPASCQASTS